MVRFSHSMGSFDFVPFFLILLESRHRDRRGSSYDFTFHDEGVNHELETERRRVQIILKQLRATNKILQKVKQREMIKQMITKKRLAFFKSPGLLFN